MAEIVFVTPTATGSVIEESVGTLLLATILRRSGLEAEILPFARFGDPEQLEAFLDRASEAVRSRGPKILSFYTRCDSYHIMLRLAERLKRETGAYIVFGGPHGDISAVDTVREIPYVDFVCRGEGETTVVPFFTSLLQDKPALQTPGLVFRRDGQVVENPRPALLEDLDTLPQIDYSFLRGLRTPEPDEVFPIDVGRGCPFGCTYCSTKTFWGRKYRLKSPQRIIEDIRAAHEAFGVTRFAFEHDMFTMNRRQVVETCALLRQLDFPVSWKCSARIDCLDRELVALMAESGLYSIFIGIETGSPRMQKLIRKNLKLEGVTELLTEIRRQNVDVIASFIYGFPEETEEDLSQTLAMMASLLSVPGITVQAHLCTFLPGTELSQRYGDALTPAEHHSDITGAVALDACRDLIDGHPALFRHFREYRTPLRTKLAWLPQFLRLWRRLPTVFGYLAELQPPLRLYEAFVADCAGVLPTAAGLPYSEQMTLLLRQLKQFLSRFRTDSNYDLLWDYYQLELARQQEFSGSRMLFLCFSPKDAAPGVPLRQLSRRPTLVTYSRNSDGTLRMQLRS